MPAAPFSSRRPGAQPPRSAARTVLPSTGRLARLSRRTAAGLALTVTVAAALPSPASHASRTAPAGGFTGGEFNGVSSASAADAWAVGSITSAQGRNFLTLVAHWDGTRWARVPSPSPGEPDVASLTGVGAVSAADAWAVGYYGTFGLSTLVLHWDGTRWTRVASPSPRLASTKLTGVGAASATDAWAVGGVVRHQVSKTFVLHWDGTCWTRVASPSQGASALNGVSDTSSRDALAAGSGATGSLALRWNGSRWVNS